MRQLTGNSILVTPSNELWAIKRKHLSAAFYKDKMTPMLGMIIGLTNESIQKLKIEHVQAKKPLDIVEYISNLLMSGILLTVFGVKMEDFGLLQYLDNG